jgi:hypothetical protein
MTTTNWLYQYDGKCDRFQEKMPYNLTIESWKDGKVVEQGTPGAWKRGVFEMPSYYNNGKFKCEFNASHVPYTPLDPTKCAVVQYCHRNSATGLHEFVLSHGLSQVHGGSGARKPMPSKRHEVDSNGKHVETEFNGFDVDIKKRSWSATTRWNYPWGRTKDINGVVTGLTVDKTSYDIWKDAIHSRESLPWKHHGYTRPPPSSENLEKFDATDKYFRDQLEIMFNDMVIDPDNRTLTSLQERYNVFSIVEKNTGKEIKNADGTKSWQLYKPFTFDEEYTLVKNGEKTHNLLDFKPNSMKECPRGSYREVLRSKGGYCGAELRSESNPSGCELDVVYNTDCIKCPAGTYQPNIGAVRDLEFSNEDPCRPCAAGQYADEEGSDACKACPQGQFREKEGGTICDICPAGKYSNVEAGAAKCDNCAKGHSTNGKSGRALCNECESGQYQDAEGEPFCKECGFLNAQSERRSDSLAMCGCAANYFHPCKYTKLGKNLTGIPEWKEHLYHRCDQDNLEIAKKMQDEVDDRKEGKPENEVRLFCHACHDPHSKLVGMPSEPFKVDTKKHAKSDLEGFVCGGGFQQALHNNKTVVFHKQPLTKENFMVTVEDPYVAWTCKKTPLQCPGSSQVLECLDKDTKKHDEKEWCKHMKELGNDCGTECFTGCASSRDGGYRGCAACKEGWYSTDSGKCKECDGLSGALLPLWILFNLGVVPFIYYFCNTPITSAVSRMAVVSVSFGLFLNMMQVLGMFAHIRLNFSLSPFTEIMQAVQLFNFDFQILRAECLFSYSPTASYMIQVLSPAFYIAWACVCHVISRAVAPRHLKWDKLKTFNTICTFFQAFFTPFVATTTYPFRCVTNPNGMLSMIWYPDVLCNFDDSEWPVMFVFGLLFLIVYGIGFMSLQFWAVWKGPEYSFKSKDFLFAFRFIFFRFRPDRWYWGPMMLMRGIVIAMIPALFADTPGLQIVLFIFTLTISLVMTARYWPWKNTMLNRTDLMIHMGLIFLTSAMSNFLEQVTTKSPAWSVIATFLVLSLTVGILSAVMPIIWLTYQGIKYKCKGGDNVFQDCTDEITQMIDIMYKIKELKQSDVAKMVTNMTPTDQNLLKDFTGMFQAEFHLGDPKQHPPRLTVSPQAYAEVKESVHEYIRRSTNIEDMNPNEDSK